MDPIANMFTQIKNGLNASKKEVIIPFSKIKLAILESLKSRQLIESYEQIKSDDKKYPAIKVILKYKESREGAFKVLNRVSRPGRRVYLEAKKIPSAQRGKIDIIISTPNGIMCGREAFKKGLGGEVVGEIA